MTREINGRIVMRVSDDGTRCAAECPHHMACSALGQRAWTGFAWTRSPACIAAEQAAASVPSCAPPRMPPWRGDPDTHIAVLRTLRYEQTSPSYGWRKPVLDALDWAITSLAEKPAAASTGHLDGGARALDASEALREARVQGMREGLSIAKGHARAYRTLCTMEVDYKVADTTLEAAIEAVRKGER